MSEQPLGVKIDGEIIYTVREVSEKLNINERTLLSHIKSGDLEATKRGKLYFITHTNLKKYVGI